MIGALVGTRDGPAVGRTVGLAVGIAVVGRAVGTAVGSLLVVGAPVGEILTPRGYAALYRMPLQPHTKTLLGPSLQETPSWGMVLYPQRESSSSVRSNLM